MKIDILDMDTLISTAYWDDTTHDVQITNYSGEKNVWLQYVSKAEKEYNVSFSDFCRFLETRCVPRTRDGIDELLKKKYGLTEYSPLQICKKTHGINYSDTIWLKFNDENLRYADVRVR